MTRPPGLAVRLIRWRVRQPTRDYLLADLEDRWRTLAAASPTRARIWYWRQTVAAILTPLPGALGVSAHGSSALGTELLHAVRSLRRRKGTSLVTILTVAVGVGAAATGFSILWGTVLRGLPFEDARELVHFERANLEEGRTSMAVTPHDYLDWAAAQRSFEGLGAYVERAPVLTGGEAPERLVGVAISAGSFDLLGVEAELGRRIRAEDEDPSAERVVVLSYRLWSARFASDPTVVGRTIRLDGSPVTVVGVMPEGFGFPIAEQLWLPLRIDLTAIDRGDGRLDVFGRLRDGATVAEARTEFDAITTRLAAAHPESNAGISASLSSFHDEYIGADFTRTVTRMAAGAFLLLLVCCANVANLRLIDGVRRRGDLALRVAVGASRSGLVRGLLVESALLSGAGAIAGAFVARMGVEWFNSAGSGAGVFDLPHGPDSLFWWNVALDLPTLFAVIGITGVAVLLGGLVPAVVSVGAVSEGIRSARQGGLVGSRLRGGIVTAQLVLVSALLVAAGHVVESLRNVDRSGTAFDVEGVAVTRLTLPYARGGQDVGYQEHAGQLRFVDSFLAELDADPAVSAAAYTTDVPLDPPRTIPFRIEGDASDLERPDVGIVTVTPDFFDVFGVTASAGRLLDDRDRAGAVPAALVNERFAERHVSDGRVVGRQIDLGQGAAVRRVEIVGVVPTLWERPGEPDREAGVYVSLAQAEALGTDLVLGPWALTSVTVAARTATYEGPALGDAIRRAVLAVDGALPVASLESMEREVERRLGRYRVWGRFVMVLAVAGLVLAALGVYGLLSFDVSARTRELGVRRALGATGGSVQRDVLRSALLRIAPAVLVGLALGHVLTRGLGSMLYAVRPGQPGVLIGTLVVVAVVGLASSWWPARRAASVDPAMALRAG